ncbi:enoyl-CoA hydratase/isomerase family protein [Mycobacterium marinum]|uniref:Enoyl-CoA hydratase, EchA4_1 n=2 Tax=Mycobacterium marinum TaxID=1781 RepID=B2HG50_MYCMM|nr:enoyl-CoA hydratase/isomerase family protein [Mycobacterium marinum]ACC43162.1 enoyl-CoA hydratase, EchA4_1 [Mycobacterium marinum M]MDC8983738.1 enoyl-CoA hydratase/isomerase family protein [Mycobacterium marinum]MDC9000814.1 enoyl-CoA hydratase/isomerase family protein [Mycobacterium marinum]MDC9005743.1 enoyl-CoA hydratase/isomerase family protein [Mycobacterium marinum]MDC9011706.1 enoyl-CoA hydratase/isomerase family protein [Mycobacterium marinum]
MPKSEPPVDKVIRYDKDPETRIATITFDRPGHLNAPTIAARLRYADLLHRASIDDEVKVLVIRGEGEDLGSGADLEEFMEVMNSPDQGPRLAEFRIGPEEVKYPPLGSFRHGASVSQWYANPNAGIRGLQDFKKISILEVKGYCYGWHFYQAADADLVISSDDALFGHPSFRYYGWGPRMWWWAQTMGIRKFQEMVFTGRAFTAAEMQDCNFLNSVVPREELEAEVAKYALACARNRPNDTVFMQKVFFEIMKQFQGEYMGSLLSGFFESMGSGVRADTDDLMLDDAIEQGLGDAVKDNDSRFPPEWRLSKKSRAKDGTGKPAKQKKKKG